MGYSREVYDAAMAVLARYGELMVSRKIGGYCRVVNSLSLLHI